MRDKIRHKSIFFLSHTFLSHTLLSHTSDLGQTVWVPHVDIYRQASSWLVKCELAGVKPEDMTVSAQGSRLTISGVRRDPLAERGWEHYSMEIPYSRFACSAALPQDLEEADVESEYRDGMLLVRVRFNEKDR